jgi:hypothetical protein
MGSIKRNLAPSLQVASAADLRLIWFDPALRCTGRASAASKPYQTGVLKRVVAVLPFRPFCANILTTPIHAPDA